MLLRKAQQLATRKYEAREHKMAHLDHSADATNFAGVVDGYLLRQRQHSVHCAEGFRGLLLLLLRRRWCPPARVSVIANTHNNSASQGAR